ncbi:MAG: hypothetical protein M3O36_16305 [Myxococcota bacterium]|nr:hypothetical protein [Myxococcota bacterium]
MFAFSAFAAASAILACGCGSRPAAIIALPREARWQDVFAATPDVMVTVRPKALRRDPLYGALLERSIELARMRSRAAPATRAFEAIGDAEEIVVGASSSTTAVPENLVVVVRGVRGDIDPVRLVDSEGRALWLPGPSGGVRELVSRFDQGDSIAPDAGGQPEREPEVTRSPTEASLFELPGRTWVIAAGSARQRARDVFSQAGNRATSVPVPVDPQALASVRIAGPALVAHVRALQNDGGLAAVGRQLRALTIVLPADGFPEATKRPAYGRNVQFSLSYQGEHSAELAEATLRGVIAAFANVAAAKTGRVNVPADIPPPFEPTKTTVGLEWLAGAAVARSAGAVDERDPAGDARVTVTAALPQTLIDALLHMSSVRWVAPLQNRSSSGASVAMPAIP